VARQPGVGGEVWGKTAVVGIAGGGLLPLGFLFLITGLWCHVAQADLARGDSGALAAARRGLKVLGRRLGAVAVLVVLFVGAGFALALLFVACLCRTRASPYRCAKAGGFGFLILLFLLARDSQRSADPDPGFVAGGPGP